MKRNPSMTEEDWRWFVLWTEAKALSAEQVELLEEQLRVDQANLDIRVQLLTHYQHREQKYKDSEQNLFKQILWLIENKPSLSPFLCHRVGVSAICFKPKHFAMLRDAWLEQVAADPMDGTVLGNAGSFLVWKDVDTAANLFERAYDRQPAAGWLRQLVIALNFEVYRLPLLYRDEIREQLIDAGVRSLKTEPGGAIFMTCEYVSDAALSLWGALKSYAGVLRSYANGTTPHASKWLMPF